MQSASCPSEVELLSNHGVNAWSLQSLPSASYQKPSRIELLHPTNDSWRGACCEMKNSWASFSAHGIKPPWSSQNCVALSQPSALGDVMYWRSGTKYSAEGTDGTDTQNLDAASPLLRCCAPDPLLPAGSRSTTISSTSTCQNPQSSGLSKLNRILVAPTPDSNAFPLVSPGSAPSSKNNSASVHEPAVLPRRARFVTGRGGA